MGRRARSGKRRPPSKRSQKALTPLGAVVRQGQAWSGAIAATGGLTHRCVVSHGLPAVYQSLGLDQP